VLAEQGSWQARGFAGGSDLLVTFHWYDAIFIDQEDMERTQQVVKMGKIYRVSLPTKPVCQMIKLN